MSKPRSRALRSSKRSMALALPEARRPATPATRPPRTARRESWGAARATVEERAAAAGRAVGGRRRSFYFQVFAIDQRGGGNGER